MRAYPIAPKNLPTSVTIDFTSDGVSYNHLRYAPAGTVNFKVNNTDITNTNLSNEDDINISDTDAGTGFWGR